MLFERTTGKAPPASIQVGVWIIGALEYNFMSMVIDMRLDLVFEGKLWLLLQDNKGHVSLLYLCLYFALYFTSTYSNHVPCTSISGYDHCHFNVKHP